MKPVNIFYFFFSFKTLTIFSYSLKKPSNSPFWNHSNTTKIFSGFFGICNYNFLNANFRTILNSITFFKSIILYFCILCNVWLKIANYILRRSNLKNPTFDRTRFGCRIFDIRRWPISDRKSNRIFLHTSILHSTVGEIYIVIVTNMFQLITLTKSN